MLSNVFSLVFKLLEVSYLIFFILKNSDYNIQPIICYYSEKTFMFLNKKSYKWFILKNIKIIKNIK